MDDRGLTVQLEKQTVCGPVVVTVQLQQALQAYLQ
jgi:hypothetical protein